MNRAKTITTAGVALSVFATLLLFLAPAVSAASGGASDGGSEVASKCTAEVNNAYNWLPDANSACEHAGTSWVFFKYDNGFKGSLPFMPAHKDAGGREFYISSTCTKYGGFWHYGYNMKKKNYTQVTGNIKMTSNGFTSSGNPPWNTAINTAKYPQNRDKNFDLMKNNLNQRFYDSNNKLIAHADHASRDGKGTEVYKAYEKYRKDTGQTGTWNGNWGNITYFCSGSDSATTVKLYPKATLWLKEPGNSSGKLFDSGSTLERKSDAVDIWFYNYIDRFSDGFAAPAIARWWVEGNFPSNIVNSTSWTDIKINYGTPGASGSQKESEGSRVSPYMKGYQRLQTGPGYDEILYQDFWSTSWATESGPAPVGSGYHNYTGTPNRCDLMSKKDGRLCIRIKRNPANFAATQSLTVRANARTYTSADFGNKIVLNDGETRVDLSYSFDMTRNDARDAGSSVASRYEIYDENGKVISGDTVSLTNGQSMSTKTITNSITLLPGETRTICRDASYDSTVNVKSGNTRSRTGKQCFTVSRPRGLCIIDGQGKEGSNIQYPYDSRHGENYGGITVENKTTQKVDAAYNLKPTSPHKATVWAKAGDNIRFKHEICAGEQARFDYTGKRKEGSTYKIGAMNGDDIDAALDLVSDAGRLYRFGNRLNNKEKSATTDFTFGGTGSTYGRYEDVIWSPDKSNTSYNCKNPAIPGFFQIPGEQHINDCNSSRAVQTASNVGTFITQYMSIPYRTIVGIDTRQILEANVMIPYNYLVSLNEKGDTSTEPVQAGTDINVGFEININPRCNQQVRPGCKDKPLTYKENYATISKMTKHRILHWKESPDAKPEDIMKRLGKGNDVITMDGKGSKVLGYAIAGDPADLKIPGLEVLSGGPTLIHPEGEARQYNPGKNTLGNGPVKVSIPEDEPVGTKHCFAAAVWPSDSHANPQSVYIDSDVQAFAFGIGEKFNFFKEKPWRASTPVCYTVGKQTSIAVTGSELYAQGGTQTTVSYRRTGGSEAAFGSWGEYSLRSTERINGTASGATLAGGGKSVNRKENSCYYSPLTISNVLCSEGILGDMDKSLATSPIKDVVDNIRSRFTAKTNSQGTVIQSITAPGATRVIDLSGACVEASVGESYHPVGGDGYDCLSNGTKYSYSTGTIEVGSKVPINVNSMNEASFDPSPSIYVGRGGLVNGERSRIIVVHAKNINVNRNIFYGNAGSGRDAAHSLTNYQSAGEIPQVILIAENSINIAENVSNVDAWLIADKINTCSGVSKIGAGRCNLQLAVNGPVFAKHVDLYRTHGGGSGGMKFGSAWSTSISNGKSAQDVSAPAEIFRVGPETYIWAFAQTQTSTQATTTYQREIAPRF